MNSRLLVPLALSGLALGAAASAQQSLRSRLAPLTAPIRHAGVYHIATGTWTRHASLANVTGPDTIYNNTCAAVYFAPMQLGDEYQHASRIPSPTGPTRASVFYGTQRNDEAPGCQTSYTVNGFEIAYCSSAMTSIDWQFDFASLYTSCAADMIPQYTVLVTGMPGGTSGGAQQCWVVDVDISGHSGGGIVLSADGDGTYSGISADNTFGFGVGPASAVSLADLTGPMLAGDYTWTGGPHTGPLTPCAGTDGTIWDNPINLAESGTGMSSNNFVRVTGPSPSQPPGCYDFGPSVHSDFYLELYANAACTAGCDPCTAFCFPGEGGIHACTTCSPPNPPSAHGRGCDNYGQHTGGAQLSTTGNSSVSADTLVFTSSFENNTAFTIVLQGTATTNQVYGAGIRCVGGILKRIYNGSAGSASNGDPAGVIHRPGPDDMTSVHQASLNHGYDIGAHAPITLYYLAYYRDPNASATCGGATFNASQTGSLNWIP